MRPFKHHQLTFTCSVDGVTTIDIIIDQDGEVGFLINDADGACIGEVCGERKQAIELRDWLTRKLRDTKP